MISDTAPDLKLQYPVTTSMCCCSRVGPREALLNKSACPMMAHLPTFWHADSLCLALQRSRAL